MALGLVGKVVDTDGAMYLTYYVGVLKVKTEKV